MSAIKALREKAGITQGDLGKQLDVDRSTVAKWELGAALPRADKLPALAKALNCTIEELLADPDRR